MKTKNYPLFPLRASLVALAFCAAGAYAHAAVFLIFGSTGYVTGGDEHLEGDTLANRLGGADGPIQNPTSIYTQAPWGLSSELLPQVPCAPDEPSPPTISERD